MDHEASTTMMTTPCQHPKSETNVVDQRQTTDTNDKRQTACFNDTTIFSRCGPTPTGTSRPSARKWSSPQRILQQEKYNTEEEERYFCWCCSVIVLSIWLARHLLLIFYVAPQGWYTYIRFVATR